MTKRPSEEADPDPGPPADLSPLSRLAPELAATLAAVASDIALVVDADGTIRNVAVAERGSPVPAAADWVGRRWADTVTESTRPKIELLLDETKVRGLSQRREVTLRCATGNDIPVAYTAIRLGEHGPLLAVGRDLRAIAAIQQRFVESQKQMERDYWRRRQAEARYRVLFQVATDAVLVVDAQTHRVVEANRAAARLFETTTAALTGSEAAGGFGAASRQAIDDLLTAAQTQGRAAEIRVRSDLGNLLISAAPFHAEGLPLLLLRVRAAELADDAAGSLARRAELVERTPDAIVVTDTGGRIRIANPAFLSLCELAADADVTGRALGEWIGQSSRELAELLDAAQRHGIAAPMVTRLRAGAEAQTEIEITAALMPEGDQDSIGITIRRRPPRSSREDAAYDDLARAIERLASRLGNLRLPTLMREGSDVVERHLLKAALERSADDTAAAELLGISEESLLLRLQRHGLRPGGELTAIGS